MACIDIIERVRACINARLREVSDQQADAISYYMDLRGNPETDCQALASAVASMLDGISDQVAADLRQETHADDADLVVKIRHKHPQHIRARVAAEFNGTNADQLATRYGISRRTVYNYARGG